MANELKISKNSYIYGLLILSLLISIVVGFLLIRPTFQDNKKQQEILDNRKKVVKTLEDKKSKLVQLSDKAKELKEMVAKIDKAIPVNEDRKGFAYQIFSIASEAGVSIVSVDTTVAAVSVDGTTSSSSVIGVNEIKFSVSGRASYVKIVEFMDKLKKSLRLSSIDSVSISGTDVEALDVNFTVSTYTRGELTSNEQL